MKRTKLKQAFSKKHLKPILAVEYQKNGVIIHTTNQIEMEKVTIQENETQFQLAYDLPLFEISNL